MERGGGMRTTNRRSPPRMAGGGGVAGVCTLTTQKKLSWWSHTSAQSTKCSPSRCEFYQCPALSSASIIERITGRSICDIFLFVHFLPCSHQMSSVSCHISYLLTKSEPRFLSDTFLVSGPALHLYRPVLKSTLIIPALVVLAVHVGPQLYDRVSKSCGPGGHDHYFTLSSHNKNHSAVTM